jgi:hypothetical protein
VPVGTEFQVSSYTNGGWFPRVASDAEGNFVVVWFGPQHHIYGQRYSSVGEPLGSEFRVSTDKPVLLLDGNFFRDIDVSASADGAFVIVWTSFDNTSDFNVGVYGRRFDSAGSAMGAEFQVNTYTSPIQYNPSVAMAPTGGFVVAWENYDGIYSASRGVSGRLFDSSGTPMGMDFRVSSFTYFQSNVDVAPRKDGSFVFVWQDAENAVGQIYAGDGSQIGSRFHVSSGAAFRGFPGVQAAQDGSFIVVWIGNDGGGAGMSGRRFDSSGSPLGSEFQVNSSTVGAQYNVNHGLFVAPDGDFVVAWMTQAGGLDWPDGVAAQRFHSTGERDGTEFQVNTVTTRSQAFPAVGGGPNGFVITWMSDALKEDYFRIVGQRYLNEAVCPETPASDCFPASRSALVIRRPDPETRRSESFVWGWRKNPAVDWNSSSSPSAYLLCLYDSSGLAGETRVTGSCDTESCWGVTASPDGRHRNRWATNRGRTRARREDKLSKLVIRGRGTNLALPALPLDDSAPVVVQLHSSTGRVCLEATYPGPALRNHSNEYRDRAP